MGKGVSTPIKKLGYWESTDINMGGSGNPLVKGTAYLVSSDGLVCAFAVAAASGMVGMASMSNPPGPGRAYGNLSNHTGGFCMPVQKGEYFKVDAPNTPTIYWRSFK